jgi:histidine triad (HIT) family protein
MCIFCKIINNEIPSIKIREDENFIAILDAFPNVKGQALVMPKKHYDSDIAEIDSKVAQDSMTATQKVIKLLKK